MGAGRRLLEVVLVLVVVAVVAKPGCENSSFSGLPTPLRLPGPDTAAGAAQLASQREAVISPTTSGRWAEHRYASDTLLTIWAMVHHCFPSTKRPPNLLVNRSSPIMSMHHIFCYILRGCPK